MSYAINTITNNGDTCNRQMVDILKTLAENVGWTTLRYNSTVDFVEVILHSVGMSGVEDLYIGFKSYQSVSDDYYNLKTASFVGFSTSNDFENQPGACVTAIHAHNNVMTYFITANMQRVCGCFKVGTPIYDHFYVGKFLPYARPSEYPIPLVSAASMKSDFESRYSDVNYNMPYLGFASTRLIENIKLRNQAGVWEDPLVYPFSFGLDYASGYVLAGQNTSMVPAGDHYQLEPLILYQQPTAENRYNVYGQFDGVYYCSGFNNTSENVLQEGGSSVVNQTGLTVDQAVSAILAVSGRAFILLQNGFRTTWRDFIALEMK